MTGAPSRGDRDRTSLAICARFQESNLVAPLPRGSPSVPTQPLPGLIKTGPVGWPVGRLHLLPYSFFIALSTANFAAISRRSCLLMALQTLHFTSVLRRT